MGYVNAAIEHQSWEPRFYIDEDAFQYIKYALKIFKRVNPFRTHKKQDLKACKHHKYRKIFGELKWQRTMKPQSISFLNLPTELWVMIYRLYCRLDKLMELWAEPGSKRKTAHRSLCQASRSLSSLVFDSWSQNQLRFPAHLQKGQCGGS